MSTQFETCVDYGINLSKRIYYGKQLPPSQETMSKSAESLLPSAVMVYAVVPEPDAVDNPDVPSYQPYVFGRCEPPALIPLHMHEKVGLEIECWFDHARVSFSGTWRMHCIMAARKCECRLAVPLGEHGSLLGVEIDVTGKSYHSQLIVEEEEEEESKDKQSVVKGGDGGYLKGNIYTFKIPQVAGGSYISVKVCWSQKLVYNEGEFRVTVPFSFPAFVNPVGYKNLKREHILLNVNSGIGKEIICKSTSHALKEMRREVGKVEFLYDAEVPNWSATDFNFSYTVPSGDLFGGVLLHPPLHDDRQIFSLYVYPGNTQIRKVFRKEVIFLVDISGSMKGDPFETTKSAVLASLAKLNPEDSFNIIAFNGETYLFSSLLEKATSEAISKASDWLSNNVNADGETNIFLPLKQAVKLLAETTDAVPLIFLITDGAVQDERDICNFVKASTTSGGSISPRIFTLGIGTYCNHYFLKKLAQLGRGHFDYAYDADSIDTRMQRLFSSASSIILVNLTVNAFKHLGSLELFPCNIPDLSYGKPLVVSGRYNGNFPDSIKISGILADMSIFTLDLEARKAKDVPLDMIIRDQIDALTADAWLMESKDLKQKIARLSLQTGIPSEYTFMILHQADKAEKASETIFIQEVFNKVNLLKKTDTEGPMIIFLGNLGVGFGDLKATADNVPPGVEIKKLEGTDILVNAASACCNTFLDRCCCMCFIRTCSYVNDQCAIVSAQICTALACVECLNCCYELWG